MILKTAYFGIKTQKKVEATNYYLKTQEKLKNPNILENPYFAETKLLMKNDELLFLLKLKHKWIQIYWLGLGMVVASQFFFGLGLNWLAIVGLAFYGVTAFFYTQEFAYLMLVLGLRKHGYKGKYAWMSKQKLLEVLWDAD